MRISGGGGGGTGGGISNPEAIYQRAFALWMHENQPLTTETLYTVPSDRETLVESLVIAMSVRALFTPNGFAQVEYIARAGGAAPETELMQYNVPEGLPLEPPNMFGYPKSVLLEGDDIRTRWVSNIDNAPSDNPVLTMALRFLEYDA